MIVKRIKNKDTFKFFNYKWKKVPEWATKTENIYINWYLRRYRYKNLSRLKKFLKNKKYILEAGCGVARDSKLFAKLNPKANVFGCDQSINAVNRAKKDLKEFKNVTIFQQDITKKIKLNTKFDFISCDQVLHHTPYPGRTLKNLFSLLKKNGYLNFFVCRKKNDYRDLVDDHIMMHFRGKSPKELWNFAVKVTNFAKILHELKIKNINFKKKKYKNLQLYIHNNVFRAWYNPDLKFDLSVSSNYDWFSNNPRFELNELKKIVKMNLRGFKYISIYEDDASISMSIKKIN
mgnify:FL=1